MRRLLLHFSPLFSIRWVGGLAGLAGLAAVALLAAWQIQDAPAPPSDEYPYRIVGYVGGAADIWRVDAARLTHINYAFAQVSEEGEIYFRDEDAPAHLAQIQALKAKNPDLKLLVSVGGWGADGFSDAALTKASRERFARSAVEFVKRYALDGIDLDWEFLGQPRPGITHRAEDEQNFTLLLKTVRTRLDALSDRRGLAGAERYLLTIASNDDQAYFDHTEMNQLHVYLDFINVMTYDFFSSGSPTTGHHTGLYRSGHPDAPVRTAAAAARRHLDAGIPPDKIVLGVAFYGRGWTGVRPEQSGLHQPYERFTRAYSYSTLADEYINKRGFTRYWDAAAKAPYLWNPDSTTFISYDDPESLRHKVAFVKEKGLGGVMFWAYHHDDDAGTLLSTLYENLY